MQYYYSIPSPIGTLYAVIHDEKIAGLSICHPHGDIKAERTATVSELEAQLEEYFRGERRQIDIEFKESGTDWQRKCYREIRNIPYGEVRTYKQIAAAVGNTSASRAVGRACNANPLLIITPCHRVVGTSGALTGFAAGLEAKRKLIEIEKSGAI